MHHIVRAKLGAHDLIIETGKLAKQADGAVTVQYGETVVLVAVTAAPKPKPDAEFFPLTVDYREKAAAVGRFPGGYFKREGRPTEKEILTSRLTDRPLRSLFPKGFYNETQVQAILLSADGENDPDILSVIGASAALTVSNIPWNGPIGCVRVGRVNGQLVANPTHAQRNESDLDLVYAGTESEMLMIEGSAREISEADMMGAFEFAQENVKKLVALQRELAQKVGVEKFPYPIRKIEPAIWDEATRFAGDRILQTQLIKKKLEREDANSALKTELATVLKEKFPNITDWEINETYYTLQRDAVRKLALEQGKRCDGRGAKDIRPIHCEVGVLPRVHGSAIFQRGETQALVFTTLGSASDAQELDAYTGGKPEKTFMLHYNFPNFSVGEVGRIMGPGRREIGHGALAERSVEPMIPKDDFPYTIRVTSEIMESNGSTSMATVCGATLSLMDAGVPLKRPVAGISIGLVTDDKGRAVTLTDILGLEDAFGDMDFKIAGTRNGITGFQLDLKIAGLRADLVRQAVEEARVARMFLLDKMAETLPAPRKELSKYAPRIQVIHINPEKIGAVIGPQGKVIKKITEETGVQIDIEDSGEVHIFSTDAAAAQRAIEQIQAITAEVEVGKIYRGKVVGIKEFGAFVEILPDKDGLCHISELADFRVKSVEDVVKLGDEVFVKVIGIDDRGKIKLSRKQAMAEKDAAAQTQSAS
jgi:polyribonucleotide nucleotidyltransferase